jgi:hypothetical protein
MFQLGCLELTPRAKNEDRNNDDLALLAKVLVEHHQENGECFLTQKSFEKLHCNILPENEMNL